MRKLRTLPVEVQYAAAKARHPGRLVLIRVDEFYEAFQKDAETVASVLGLTTTYRTKKGDTTAMVGFPHTVLEEYLAKLVEAGHRVALTELDLITED
jgi:DNA mismatch repair protein MutS